MTLSPQDRADGRPHDECTTHLTMGVCDRGTPGCSKQHGLSPERRDMLTLLQRMTGPCEGADEHSWRKCQRCNVLHLLDMRDPLVLRLLHGIIGIVLTPEGRSNRD